MLFQYLIVVLNPTIFLFISIFSVRETIFTDLSLFADRNELFTHSTHASSNS